MHLWMSVGELINGAVVDQTLAHRCRQMVDINTPGEVAQQVTHAGFHGWFGEIEVGEIVQGAYVDLFRPIHCNGSSLWMTGRKSFSAT